MKLSPEISQEIIARAKTVLHRDVVVADERGIITAGNDDGSNKIVVDALRACQEGRVIHAELNDELIAWCPFVYEDHTIGAFGIIEEEVRITPEAISLLQGLSEVIAHQHFLMEHIQPTETMRAQFLRQALSSTAVDTAEIYRQADILQLNLRSPQAAMLIEIEGFEAAAGSSEIAAQRGQTLSNQLLTTLPVDEGASICCYIGSDQFVLLKGIDASGSGLTTRNTARFLHEAATKIFASLEKLAPKQTVSLGVGQYYPDLGGLRKSYQEAKLALQVGCKVWASGQIYHITQVGMFVTLANVAQERKAELAHQILHPLLRDEQLYKTVQVFLSAGLNLTDAAGELHIHRNTLIYRLDKVKKLIGLDPRVFDDALQIKLGLMFYQEEGVAPVNGGV